MIEKKTIALAKKLRELSERGIGGEKINAEKILKNLMEKHGITAEQIEEPDVERRVIKYKPAQSVIAFQIIKRVTNGKVYSNPALKNTYISFCTNSQFLEIEAMIDFYWREYKKDLERFEVAFILKNGLFGEDEANQERKELTKERKAENEKIRRMMESIELRTLRKQLRGAKNE